MTTNNPIATNDKAKLENAVHRWINGFNEIPDSAFDKLVNCSGGEITEITPVTKGSRVYVSCKDMCGEIVGISDNGVYKVKLDETSEIIEAARENITLEHDSILPMWGSIWSFHDCADMWLDDEENRKKMAACGFRIYKQEDYGYIFGIDGAGYDFYEAHWLPLYKACGLKWHI